MTDGHVRWLLPTNVLSAIHVKVTDEDFGRYDACFENQNYRRK